MARTTCSLCVTYCTVISFCFWFKEGDKRDRRLWRLYHCIVGATMPFKIVKTIEKGKEKLSIIPSTWERSGILRWPVKNIKLLIQNEESRPQPDWMKMECVVKRTFLPTYKKAEEELKDMLDYSDTCTSDYPEKDERSKMRSNATEINYNEMATRLMDQQQCVEDEVQTIPIILENNSSKTYIVENNKLQVHDISVQDSAVPTTASTTFAIPADNTLYQINTEDRDFQTNTFDKFYENQKKTLENQKVIMENQKVIMENQSVIHDIQNNILAEQEKSRRNMANLTVLIEDTFERLTTGNQKVVTIGEANPIESEVFMIKPIKDINELNQLENNLCDKAQKQKMYLQFGLLCNKSEGTGINCAYKLLDIMFTREFLNKCSWSGGSKGQETKIPLKGFKNTLNFFFFLVNSWDATYTHDQNEKFFKTVLRNSSKRLEIKSLRASTKRTRKNCDTTTSEKRKKIAAIVQSEKEIVKMKDGIKEATKQATAPEEALKSYDMSNKENEIFAATAAQSEKGKFEGKDGIEEATKQATVPEEALKDVEHIQRGIIENENVEFFV